MAIIPKSSKPKTTSPPSAAATDNHRGNGMGFLLVFFPDSKPELSMKRTNSNNPILTKTQSTISICAFLFLFSFLLFALSNFEPPIPPPSSLTVGAPRRFLSERAVNLRSSPAKFWLAGRRETEDDDGGSGGSDFALQGMGRIYRRGTRSMAELLVGHVAEDTTEDEFRLFLRLLHRSGVTSRADVVFLFASSSVSRSGFEAVIREENKSFSALLEQHCSMMNRSESKSEPESPSWSRFAASRFVKRANRKEMTATAVEQSLWGKKIRANGSVINGSNVNSTSESTRGASYGSVVGFEANELDPENSLSGFINNPTIALRRWACYPMLFGRVKRNFKHIILADVKSALILPGDPLARVRNRAPESVMYFSTAAKRGHRAVNPAVLMGGARGVRRFSSAMLTEIVRAAMQQQQHKKKGGGGVTESAVLTRLLMGSSGEHILKNVKTTASAESIPDAGALREWGGHDYWLIQRVNGGGNHMIKWVIMSRICSCDRKHLLSPVYRDCNNTELESAN